MTKATAAAADTLKVFVPITKVDAAKGIVYGTLAIEENDHSGEVFDYDGSKPYFEAWSASVEKATAGKSLGNLRAMHGQVAAGKFTDMVFDDANKRIEVSAKIVDANELTKVTEGVYTGFSIGGKYVKRWKDGDVQRYIANPYEGSLVDLPCMPSATFEVIKAAGGENEIRKFKTVTAEPVVTEPDNEAVVTKAQEIATAKGDVNLWPTLFAEARTELMKAAPATEPVVTHEVPLAVTAVDDDEPAAKSVGTEESWEQVWQHPELPGKTFKKKGDLVAALTTARAQAVANKAAAPVRAAIAEITADLDKRKPGGATDEPKPAPVNDPAKATADALAAEFAELAKAGPATNVARRALVAKAIAAGAVSVIPTDIVDPDNRLEKMVSLYSVSSLISLLGSLEGETHRIGDSNAPYYYGEGTTRIEAPEGLVTRMKGLMGDLGDVVAELLDDLLAQMTSDDAEKALSVGHAFGDLMKIGARNSKADKGRIRRAHDLLAEVDPQACGVAEKTAPDGDLAKVVEAQGAAFESTLGELTTLVKDMAERVRNIEASPLPEGSTSVRNFNVVEKSDTGFGALPLNDPNAQAFASMQGERLRLGSGR